MSDGAEKGAKKVGRLLEAIVGEKPDAIGSRERERLRAGGGLPSLGSPQAPAAPRCPDCGAVMVLRVARRGRGAGRKFFGCSAYPTCATTHPAHKDGTPIGEPADARTRTRRAALAKLLGRLALERYVVDHREAYRWMRGAMGLEPDERAPAAQLSTFTIDDCNAAITLAEEFMDRSTDGARPVVRREVIG